MKAKNKQLSAASRALLGLENIALPAEVEQALVDRFDSMPYAWRTAPARVSEAIALTQQQIRAYSRAETFAAIAKDAALGKQVSEILILPLFSVLLKPPIMRTFSLAAGPLSSVAQTPSG